MITLSDDPKDIKKEEPKQEPVVNPFEDKVKELEKKLGDLSNTLAEQNEYIQGTSVVLNTIAYTPELKQQFQSAVQRLYNPENGQQLPQVPPQAPVVPGKQDQNAQIANTVKDVATSQRESIILQFEKDYGLEGMKDTERKDSRGKIEKYLNEFGQSAQTAPLTVLRANLEKAYIGSHAEKLKEEGKLEGFAQGRAVANGIMGTFPGGVPIQNEDKKALNDKQTKWVERLGIDPEKVKKVMTQDEQKVIPKSEVKE